jgi:hypothetical protein
VTRRSGPLSFALMVLFTTAVSALFLAPAHSAPVGNEFIPPEHWSYPALDRFEDLGLVELPDWGLFTRPDVVAFTRAIRAAADSSGRVLDSRSRFDLDRLEREFGSEKAQEDPGARYDRPVLNLEEKPVRVEGDADLAVAP